MLKASPCKVRVKWSRDCKPTRWENSVFILTSRYLETDSLGPVPMREVEWVEVNTIEIRYIGRLLRDLRIDHADNLIETCNKKAIKFEQIEQILRFVYPST
jgi:hypothetical protein